MDLDTAKPFTRAEALAKGLTVWELAGPRFRRLFHDCYLSSEVAASVLERGRAALKVCPEGTYLSHHTAGAIWGGCVPDTSEIHVSVRPGLVRSRRSGIKSHRGGSDTVPIRHRGLLVSAPVGVFVELAASGVDLVDLVVFGDSLVRAGRVEPANLVTAMGSWSGPGARRGRRAAALVRKGVDSAQESRLRMLLLLAGLPEPEVNWILRTADGEWQRRFDLCYPALKIIVEYDGKQHLRDSAQWNRDLRRREELERQGWTVIVITSDALFNEPDQVLLRVREVLRQRGCRNLPTRFKAEWERHFPVRASA